MSQLAADVRSLKEQNSGKLPAQAVTNPKETVNAIEFRSGKVLQPQVLTKEKLNDTIQREDEETPKVENEVQSEPLLPKISNNVAAPFPSRLANNKKDDYEQGILDTFHKVEINIPLLDTIKQILKYAKFLKELCTNKRKFQQNETVSM